jgi:CheY-like chemotaxis protein
MAQMPGIEGETLGKEIKKDPDLKDTILVMLTSLKEQNEKALNTTENKN